MKSKVGSILTLIGGIINIVFAVLMIVFLILLLVFPERAEGNLVVGVVIILILFIFLSIIAVLKFIASNWMKNPKTTTKGGIMALIVGILTSDIFSIIGGILGIVQGGQS